MRPANPLLVVIDPTARARDAESTRIAVDVLRAAEPVRVVIPGSRSELDRVLARGAHGRAVVVGADGALHAVVASLRRTGRLAEAALGLVPVGEHERHARGCCLAGSLGLPAAVAHAARIARGSVFRDLDLLVDDAGGIAIGRVRVGVPALRWARDHRPRAEPLNIPRQTGDPMLRLLLAQAGAVARAGMSASLVAAATGTQLGWQLRVEADGRPVGDEHARVTGVELGAGATPAAAPGQVGPAPGAADRGRADVLVTTAGRSGPQADGWPAELRTLRAARVRVRGQAFPYACDGRPSEAARLREWTVEPAAWRLAVPP